MVEKRLLHGDIIYHVLGAFDTFGKFPRTIFGFPGISESAQLDSALEGRHLHVVELELRIFVQRFLDARGDPGVVDAFAGAFVIAVTGASGY